MAGSSSEDEGTKSLIQRAISKALAPVHVATSRPALKAYLGTILFLSASLALLAISTTAYLLFYYNFIPQVSLSKVIHLQYADARYPHSTTYLTSSSSTTSSLISLQPYDVTIHLHVPRTPTNLAAGNFMLDLSLISPPLTTEQPLSTSSLLAPTNRTTLLARSRRPAILPYQSPITSIANTFFSLPLHTLSIRDIDATKLSVPMFEQVSFARGWRNVPLSARLEIQTQPHTQAAMLGQVEGDQQHVPMQIYSASIEFHARFQGLRWWMYNWRILSFLTFTSGFYCVALVSTGIAWGLIAYLYPSSPPTAGKEEGQPRKIKKEAEDDQKARSSNGHAARPVKTEPADERDEDAASGEESPLSVSNLSDNATTFPTLGRQMPLRYPLQSSFQHGSSTSASGSARIKQEEIDHDNQATDPLLAAAAGAGVTTAGEFAEDEEEEEELDDFDDAGFDRGRDRDRDRDRDSGLGTSMEESAREATGLHRRRGGGGSGGSFARGRSGR